MVCSNAKCSSTKSSACRERSRTSGNHTGRLRRDRKLGGTAGGKCKICCVVAAVSAVENSDRGRTALIFYVDIDQSEYTAAGPVSLRTVNGRTQKYRVVLWTPSTGALQIDRTAVRHVAAERDRRRAIVYQLAGSAYCETVNGETAAAIEKQSAGSDIHRLVLRQ